MKKILLVFFVFLSIISIDEVGAISKLDEDFEVVFDTKGVIDFINITVVIPQGCDDELLLVDSSLFSVIKHYKELTGGNSIKINFIIKNNSSYTYSYLKNSFQVVTADIDKNCMKSYLVDTGRCVVDKKNIYTTSAPYRTFNTALNALYHSIKVYDNDLSSDKLYFKLKQKGYLGDRALELYYLDYYNKKYHLSKKRLEDFPTNIIKEIFSGISSDIKETDEGVIELSYNYFYKNVLFLTFLSGQVKDFQYNMFVNMKKGLEDIYFRDKFNLIRGYSNKRIDGMAVNMSLENYTSAFSNYNYYVDMKFKLKKIN